MKTLLKIIFLTIIASIMLASCKQMSVMKRKYNKGYYVEYTKKKADLKNENNTVTKTEKADVLKPVAITSLPKETTPGKKEYEPTASIQLPENVPPQPEKVKTFKDHLNIRDNFKLITTNPVKLFNDELSYKMNQDPARDALSLFWVIIVVILIIYLIGLLLDGYGLGLAIHILAVIALVLLILWLLRVL